MSDPAPRTWRTRSRELWLRAKARWSFLSRSLLFRVVVLTLTLSTLVMLVLGLILQQQITTGLLQSKIDAATAEIDSARMTVENSLSGADSDPTSLREQLRLALTEIGRADGSSGVQGSAAGVFDPVIVPSRIGSDSADLSVDQPLGDVPAELRARIGQGQMSYQYTTIHRDGESLPALVVGSPARTATDSFEVYLIFPLAGEQGTVQVVQRTLLLGGVALVLALTLISALVAAQVVRPVQRAAGSAAFDGQVDEAADQFLDGHARGFPHLGIHGDRGEAGDGVDLVDVEIAVIFVEEEIHARHAGQL